MPYIKLERRFDYPDNGRELCYKLYHSCLAYLRLYGKKGATIGDIIMALEWAKLEFYRREVGPFEDEKIKENGDID